LDNVTKPVRERFVGGRTKGIRLGVRNEQALETIRPLNKGLIVKKKEDWR